ncbi:gsl1139 [Gloeobacter violaceus PCC 7421]|uniref:Gsl1139 protein n=1 Tax=Gloeobacter violaceus (strain ATCC 29082 / PCC 7421) TaxID=251221 RepID=Q7NLI4_GLOVI|nr:gsl1139 [Gloeobacter violaceus PCC 7421]
MSCLVLLCATVVAAAILAGITYYYGQSRSSARKALRYTPIARPEPPKSREELIAMLERQFNNSPSSGPPERNL